MLQQKERDDAREVELLKQKQDFEFNLKRMELENTLKQCEISHQNPTAESNSENSSNWSGSKFNLGLGKFNNQGLELEAHLHRFELVATSYNLPKHLWPVELSKSLTGIALETFDRLDAESQHQYELVVKALQKTFNITESTYRKLFKTSKCYPGERLAEFCNRLKSYLRLWLQKSIYSEDYEGLFSLMVSQAFFLSLDKQTQTFCKEAGKISLDELVEKAENYMQAHFEYSNAKNVNSHDNKNKFHSKFDNSGQKSENMGQNQSQKPNYSSQNGASQNQSASQKNENSFQNGKDGKISQNRSNVTCHKCGKLGHIAAKCYSISGNGSKPSNTSKVALCQLDMSDINSED